MVNHRFQESEKHTSFCDCELTCVHSAKVLAYMFTVHLTLQVGHLSAWFVTVANLYSLPVV